MRVTLDKRSRSSQGGCALGERPVMACYDYTAFFMATDTAKPAYGTFRQLIHKLGAWTKATGRPSLGGCRP